MLSRKPLQIWPKKQLLVSNNNVVEFVKPREAAEILGVNARNAC